MNLIEHLERQKAFSERTFGPGLRTKMVVDHIRKELAEIEAAPTDLEEWIDVVLLAFDGGLRAGYTPQQVAEQLTEKLAKNEARTWPDWRTADPTKAIEHVKTQEHEPFAWLRADSDGGFEFSESGHGFPVYTVLPARKPLSDDLIFEIFIRNCVDYPGNYEVTPGQAIRIARLIEKNYEKEPDRAIDLATNAYS